MPALAWLIPVLAIVVYMNTFGGDFVLDDIEIVRDNPLTTSLANLPEIFRSDYWSHREYADHGLYRPFTIATYALERQLHGGTAAGHHASNVLLHALASFVLYVLLRELFADTSLAAAAGVLFAVHPIHTEAVAGIVGRAEILAFLGTVLCIWTYFRGLERPRGAWRGWAFASIMAYLMGAMSKEGGIVAPALILMTELFLPSRRHVLRSDRRALGIFLAYLVVAALFLALRAQAISGHGVAEGFAGASNAERVFTAVRVAAEYIGLLLLPFGLSADYAPADVPLARSAAQWGVVASALVLLATIGIAARSLRAQPAIPWGLGLFLLTLLPVSNLLFPIGVMKAERLLYSPSAGFVTAVAGVFVVLAGRTGRPPAVWAALGLVTVTFSVLTWSRNRDWRDGCTLAAATLETSPHSPIFGTIMARCLLDSGRPEGARRMLGQVLETRPDFVTARIVFGVLERDAGHHDAALVHFESVLEHEPSHVVALSNTAWLFFHQERFDASANAFDRWRRASPGDPGPWAGLVAARLKAGDVHGAREIVREGLRLFPGDAALTKNALVLEEIESEP